MKHRIDRRTKAMMAERRRNNRVWHKFFYTIGTLVPLAIREMTEAIDSSVLAMKNFTEAYYGNDTGS